MTNVPINHCFPSDCHYVLGTQTWSDSSLSIQNLLQKFGSRTGRNIFNGGLLEKHVSGLSQIYAIKIFTLKWSPDSL